MLQIRFGSFNSKTCEDKCQLVFKKKYVHIGYQHIVVSSGDNELAGFKLQPGLGFEFSYPYKNYAAVEVKGEHINDHHMTLSEMPAERRKPPRN